MIESRPAALEAVRSRHRSLQLGAEHLEVHQCGDPLQAIALGRQLAQARVHVEEPRLPLHPCIPRSRQQSESANGRFRERFLEVSRSAVAQVNPPPGAGAREATNGAASEPMFHTNDNFLIATRKLIARRDGGEGGGDDASGDSDEEDEA